MKPGRLLLLPTSLGAEQGCSYLPETVLETARGLSHFVVENAKSARAELKRMGHPVSPRELSIEVLPEKPSTSDLERLAAPMLGGHDLGLMSEAGCPAVADPGALLVRHAHQRGIVVQPLVGPSSLMLALMASGLNGQQFAFHGYLPAREPERSERIAALEKESSRLRQTEIFIEAPYRNQALFSALLARLRPETRLCLASDLTLPSESIHTREVAAWRRRPAPDLDRRPTVFLLLA